MHVITERLKWKIYFFLSTGCVEIFTIYRVYIFPIKTLAIRTVCNTIPNAHVPTHCLDVYLCFTCDFTSKFSFNRPKYFQNSFMITSMEAICYDVSVMPPDKMEKESGLGIAENSWL